MDKYKTGKNKTSNFPWVINRLVTYHYVQFDLIIWYVDKMIPTL